MSLLSPRCVTRGTRCKARMSGGVTDVLMRRAQARNPVAGKGDPGKQASSGNMLMDSRKTHNGVMQSDR